MDPSSDSIPRLSIIVCTWNPGLRIKPTLFSLHQQSLDRSHYEVIIVDSACDHSSRRFLEEQGRTLAFRYVRVDEAGLSLARNAGIAAAQGEIVFFIDDDAVAPAHLADAILRCFDKHPSAAAIGGPVHGLWMDTPPRWLTSRHWRMLSLVNYGHEERTMNYPEIPIGCNISFRKSMFSKYGAFDPVLGRSGTNLHGSEERALIKSMMNDGARVMYCPDVYVMHLVPAERMTLDYFFRRAQQSTESMLVMERIDRFPPLFLHLLKRTIQAFILIPFHGIKFGLETIIVHSIMYAASVRGHFNHMQRLRYKPNDK